MSQLVGVQNVDLFSVEEPPDLQDWQVPLSFMKTRHTSVADDRDSKVNCDSWRVKDRVRLRNMVGNMVAESTSPFMV